MKSAVILASVLFLLGGPVVMILARALKTRDYSGGIRRIGIFIAGVLAAATVMAIVGALNGWK